MTIPIRRKSAAVTAGLMCASSVLLAGAAPASAASYPYRNWSQTSNNSAGVVFRPSGDYFEIWDNVRGSGGAYVEFNYKNVKDKWKWIGRSVDGKPATFQRNVYEKINGKPAYIYFRVCDYSGCSKPSWYRTWG
ncbi:hypothetical protein ACFV1X_39150 [Streptomyces coelicoflavus]|uniref:hypothetical protein n=1 Tax=Streptomyces coelicoflavus TaxID=285562 RepID=UPI0036A2AA0E